MPKADKLHCAILLLFHCFASLLIADSSAIPFNATARETADRIIMPRLATQPTIDGNLDDTAWQQAAMVNAFWLAGTDQTAEDQTVAWLGFDDENLYVAYACQDRKLKGDAHFPRDAKHIWANDGVEVHVSPTRNPEDKTQFILGVGGGKFDLRSSIGKYSENVAWNPDPDWSGAVSKTAFGYTAELAIPLDSLIDRSKYDVARGSKWKLKLTRLDYGDHNGCILSSWTLMGTHTSDKFAFGDLVFEDANLVGNGSAEQLDNAGRIAGWETPHHGMQLTMTSSTNEPTDGGRCAAIEVRGEPKGGINSRIYAGPVAPSRQPVETSYRFTADVKAVSQPGALVSYFVVFNGKEIGKLEYKHNAGWQQVETLITIEAGKQVKLPCIQSSPSNYLNKADEPGGIVYLDNVRLEQVEMREQLGDPEEVCLTGNAIGAFRTRNQRVDGRYTYSEPGYQSPYFPNWLRGESPPEKRIYDGWLRFDEGLLTDGLTATQVRWSGFWSGPNGREVVFDLGKDYLVSRVVVRGQDCLAGTVWTRPSDASLYTLAAGNFTTFAFDTKTLKYDSESETIHGPFKHKARYVRVQMSGKRASPAELQIWGKPLPDGETITNLPLLQNEGKQPVSDPKGQPVVIDDVPELFPVPLEMSKANGTFSLRQGLTIAVGSNPTERTRTTAQVLAEELQLDFKLKSQIVESDAGDITLRLAETLEHEQGYALNASAKGITIQGDDERGLFYGTMAMLSLVRLGDDSTWQVRSVNIRDWPAEEFRFIQGRPIPDKGLIRALARFRITHYEAQERYHAQAAQWDAEAQRYFVQFVPHLDPNRIVLAKDPTLLERDPNEPMKTIGHGRRNANPAHPRTWEIYEAECDKWLPKFAGNIVHINLDETYQFQGGARWNVSPESRAMNMNAGELLAWFINRIDKIAKKHGKTLLMHDTAFMHDHKLSYPGDPNPGWLAALPKLPKDLIFLNWHPDRSTDRINQAGYRQIYLALAETDWRQFDMLDQFDGVAAYMAESSFTPNKLINIAGVTWNPDAPRPNDPQAVMTTAAYIPVWNDLHIGKRLPSRFAESRDFHPVDLSAAANRSRYDTVAFDGEGFVDLGENMDLRALESGKQSMAGVQFDIIDESANNGKSFVMVQNEADYNNVMPARVEIPVDSLKAASLVFLHALEHRPGHNYLKRNELAGFYQIVYEDDTFATCDIRYAVNTANWTGRPVNSGYNPKSHNMTDGGLAWRGQTTSSLEAFLYSTEWVNPKPTVAIKKIVIKATSRPSNMNPMLFAVTATDLRLATSSENSEADLLPIERLESQKPIGKPISLEGGRDVAPEWYEVPNGIVVTAPAINNSLADNTRWDVIEFASYVGMIRNLGNYQTVRSPIVDFSFDKPRKLTGLLVTPAYRHERKTENFPRISVDVVIETSADEGNTWQPIAERTAVRPGEEAPVWIALDRNVSHKHLRVRVVQRDGYCRGWEQIVLHE